MIQQIYHALLSTIKKHIMKSFVKSNIQTKRMVLSKLVQNDILN